MQVRLRKDGEDAVRGLRGRIDRPHNFCISHKMFLDLFVVLIVYPLAITGNDYNLSRQRALLHLDITCELGACYPASGDLLIGRENHLLASSTCGSKNRERYCDIWNSRSPKCFWCETNNNTIGNLQLNHGIQNVIYKYFGIRGDSWWQSENGKEDVSVKLDLEAEFHVKQLMIKFKTLRPKAMLVERSCDFGKTWSVYRYFAYNCNDSFPGIPERTQSVLVDVVCETYSRITPSTGGEVHNFRFLPPYVSPYSEEAPISLRSTNLRINFTKLHSIGDYYAIEKITVLGACSCYGHASRCLPISGIDSNHNNKIVYGRCKCAHNTHGLNCDCCDDLFNNLPWKPAVGNMTNACKKCTCYNHATKCHFDAEVYLNSGKVGGGVCDSCQHNTTGIHCERCRPTFFKDSNVDIQDPYVCKACDCDAQGVVDKNSLCDDETDILNNKTAGRCQCKANVGGLRCDRCREGFWNFSAANPYGCEQCTCNILGTINERSCDPYNGICSCKRYTSGRNCDQCLPGFYGLSDTENGCSSCDCHPGGALGTKCNVITGQCKCQPNMNGSRCDQDQDPLS